MSTTEAQKLHTPLVVRSTVTHGVSLFDANDSSLGVDFEQHSADEIALRCNSFDALTEANKKLLQHVRDISSVVSFVGCEGSGDAICIDAEMAREDWCPMCRIGECVNAALKVTP